MATKEETIVQKHMPNFETLRRAFAHERVALVACKLRATQEDVAVLCAMDIEEDKTISMVPFAMFFNGDPYELLISPIEIDDMVGKEKQLGLVPKESDHV